VCPGSVHDSYAIQCTDLGEVLLNGLPNNYFIAADEAYPLSGSLVSRYGGSVQDDTFKDSFNFYLSRMRVRIENAFALLVGKWGSLWKPLRIPLAQVPRYILALGKLHNIGIDFDGDNSSSYFHLYGEEGRGRMQLHRHHVTTPSFLDNIAIPLEGKTVARTAREQMTKYLEDNGIVKPLYCTM
tara:strand:- start:107 stop:658 length:552 start_codon:yes stop_codon:yes gene_type:complete